MIVPENTKYLGITLRRKMENRYKENHENIQNERDYLCKLTIYHVSE